MPVYLLIAVTSLISTIIALTAVSVASSSKTQGAPQRIVSMSLASDEILSELLQNKQRLVATSALAHNASYSNIFHLSLPPQVATNIEKVASLQPDLIICSVFNQPQFIFALKRLQLSYLMLTKFTAISDILTNITNIGKEVQANTRAQTLVSTIKQRLHALVPAPHKPHVLNFFADYTMMGANTMYDSIVKHAGANNLAASLVKGFAKISIEKLVTLKPDYIIVPTGIYDRKHIAAKIKQMQGWKHLAAVQGAAFHLCARKGITRNLAVCHQCQRKDSCRYQTINFNSPCCSRVSYYLCIVVAVASVCILWGKSFGAFWFVQTVMKR